MMKDSRIIWSVQPIGFWTIDLIKTALFVSHGPMIVISGNLSSLLHYILVLDSNVNYKCQFMDNMVA